MAVRSRRLFGPTQSQVLSVFIDAFTVPADRTAVFRLVAICNNLGTAAVAIIATGATIATLKPIWEGPVAAHTTVEPLDGLVLNPGEKLWVATTAGFCWFTGAGSLLDGAPT